MNIKKYQNNFSKDIVKILKKHPDKAKKLEKYIRNLPRVKREPAKH